MRSALLFFLIFSLVKPSAFQIQHLFRQVPLGLHRLADDCQGVQHDCDHGAHDKEKQRGQMIPEIIGYLKTGLATGKLTRDAYDDITHRNYLRLTGSR